jgi:hypothetical protein
MECHEESAERDSKHHGYGHPNEIAAKGNAYESGGNCCQMGVAHEPDRPEVPDLSVALALRHIINRTDFNEWTLGHVDPPSGTVFLVAAEYTQILGRPS